MKLTWMLAVLLAVPSFLAAQDPNLPSTEEHGWRRVGEAPPGQVATQPSPQYQDQAQNQDQAPPPGQDQAPPPRQQFSDAPATDYAMPPQLTIPAGTYLTVRVNQMLSSDLNQPGDAFSATLVKPVVVNGFVIAQRGQTVGGRVAEARKAGRVEGTSRLGLQLTDLAIVDGQQVPIESQLISRTGPTSAGRDAAAIGGTTALGAAIGAAANGGVGAGIGAGAGAAAGVIGVLLTRGRPTVVYPESVLTYRLANPVIVSTERAPQAFRYVRSEDYGPSYEMQSRQGPPPSGDCYNCAPAPYPYYGYYAYGPGYYPYYYSPYYWGPGFSFYLGRGYYGPGYYGRGFYGGRGYGGFGGRAYGGGGRGFGGGRGGRR